MRVYKWERPSTWLAEKLGKVNRLTLDSMAQSMADELDDDAVEDLFGDMMDEDEYYAVDCAVDSKPCSRPEEVPCDACPRYIEQEG